MREEVVWLSTQSLLIPATHTSLLSLEETSLPGVCVHNTVDDVYVHTIMQCKQLQ